MSDPATRTGSWHFLGDLGIALTFDDQHATGGLLTTAQVNAPGTRRLRTGVLCTMADIVAGRLASRRTAPRLSVTVDLACIVHQDVDSDGVWAVARLLKAGRTTIVTETRFHASGAQPGEGDAESAPFATCLTTFVASGRPGDVMPSAARRLPIEGDGRPAFTAPIVEQLGCVERAPGVLVAELTPYVANSAGLLQGGAVALLAEAAAQSAASAVDDADAPGGTVFDLDVRYLDALRTGPVETSVTRLGERADGERWWRVELRDVGLEHRLGTVALARTAAARSTTTS